MLLNEPPLATLLSVASADLAFFSGGALAVTLENLEGNKKIDHAAAGRLDGIRIWLVLPGFLEASVQLLGYSSYLTRQDAVQAPTRSDVGVQMLALLAISDIHLT